MRRYLGGLAALGLAMLAPSSQAQTIASIGDPIGDLIVRVAPQAPAAAAMFMQARLYHSGGRGIRAFDSLGCRVTAMRTLAVDPRIIPRRTVVFIKETVGLLMPNGLPHDGYWYASDIGGGIKGARVDLFTGEGAGSMRPFFSRRINAAAVTAARVGTFQGCPPA